MGSSIELSAGVPARGGGARVGLGPGVAEVARSLGVSDGTLGNWVKAASDAKARGGTRRG